MSGVQRNIRAVQERRGFTLLELMTVVLIIGILVAIAVPSAIQVRVSMLVKTSQARLNQIDGGVRLYYADWQDYPPSTTGKTAIVTYLTASTRLVTRGKTYGPYNSLDTLPTGGGSAWADSFDNPFLYYKYDVANTTYTDNDNMDASSNAELQLSTGANPYAMTAASGGTYYRRDYLLMSRGPNALWDPPAKGGSDDITNFFNK